MAARPTLARYPSAWLAVAAWAVGGPLAAEPLHERIDRLIEARAVAPPAPLAGDADLVRRLYLDLAGRIPSGAEARSYLDDSGPEKRQALVDRLLGSPEFARHMTNVWDVALMERRGEKHVQREAWRKYLLESFLANKPYDQLVREILGADSTVAEQRPAARFLLDRDAEPNLVTRDVGRMFFGRDLQCAQCHDHPLIDDYVQADYYGLFACVNRTFVFAAKDKPVELAERAEGEADYASVFDKTQDQSGPRLPDGEPLAEPAVAAGEEYTVKPAENVRPVPKHSRRALLAAEAGSGRNRSVAKNCANRLWAQMFGRGIVDPVDLHHSDNPAVNPELLELLADELTAMKYDLRGLLRELALTRAYQRTVEPPAELAAQGAAAAAALATTAPEQQRLAAEADQARQEVEKFRGELKAARVAIQELRMAAAKAQTAAEAGTKAAAAAADELGKAQTDLAARQSLAATLAEGAAKAGAAVEKLPGDKELAQAAETLKARAAQAASEVQALSKTADERKAAAAAAAAQSKVLVEAVQAERAKVEAAAPGVAERRQQLAAALQRQGAKRSLLLLTAARGEELQGLTELAQKQAAADTAAQEAVQASAAVAALPAADQAAEAQAQRAALAEAARQAAERAAAAQTALTTARERSAEAASRRFALGSLRPLSPEQLAWSLMQATGVWEAQRAAGLAEWAKTHPAPAEGQPPSEDTAARARFVEEFAYGKLEGNLGPFVAAFAAAAGQPQSEYFASVDQALFLSNGPVVRGWAAPGGGNLAQRLADTTDPAALADELYLSVLSRRPTPAESAEVASFLGGRAGDRGVAVGELVWSLLTSAEFRFNH